MRAEMILFSFRGCLVGSWLLSLGSCLLALGIDGGVEQKNIEFQFFVDFYLVSSVL